MSRVLAEIKTADGTVRFDIDEVVAVGPERVSRRGDALLAELETSLEETLATARPAAQAVLDAFRSTSPDHLSIEFGLRLDASAGIVIAQAGVGVHFTVTLSWNPTGPT
jgi:hypothetical protein